MIGLLDISCYFLRYILEYTALYISKERPMYSICLLVCITVYRSRELVSPRFFYRQVQLYFRVQRLQILSVRVARDKFVALKMKMLEAQLQFQILHACLFCVYINGI